MKIMLCSLSQKPDPCQTKIFKSIKKINSSFFSEKIELNLKHNNTKMGLSEYYNQCLDEYSNMYDYIILCHDDVEFINIDLAFQVSKALEVYDVIGVAGSINPQIKDKNLWHLMSDRKDLRGLAGHSWEQTNNEMVVTSFGPTPSRVAIIDGVFMAINAKKISKTKTRFDEKFMFHHYDIDFSLQCNRDRLKIGVWPILLDHSSPGLREFNKNWEESNLYFKNKWKNK
jgi:GT2 family glycosyltransferase